MQPSDGTSHGSGAVEFVKTHAGLTAVPMRVLSLTALQLLDLSNNHIEALSRGVLPELSHLRTLSLDYNRLRTLPEDVASLSCLQSLSVSHNAFESLPPQLFMLTGLRKLNVSHNALQRVQPGISTMQCLQALDLGGNQLRWLPSEVALLAGLQQLNVAANPDFHLPASVAQGGIRATMAYFALIGEQHQLVAHHMASLTAPLTDIVERSRRPLPPPTEEAGLNLRIKLAQRIGIFSLGGCHLQELPPRLQKLVAPNALADVEVLNVSGNQLQQLPQWLLSAVPRLVVANLSMNSLCLLPEGWKLPDLAVIDLSFNNLEMLPSSIGSSLPSLRSLFAPSNFLKANGLPASLAAATQLQELFLTDNVLGSVPLVLGRCTALVKLSLAACQLSRLGDELASLTALRFLDLSFNSLQDIPTSIGDLTSLAVLSLAFNPLGAFPVVLGCLTALRELNLDHTGITSFPPVLGKLRLLEGLQADGCMLDQSQAALYARDPLLLVGLHDVTREALDLSDCGLSVLPQQVLALTGLTKLDLSRNAIQELPPGLGRLRRLMAVCVRGNPLRQPYQRVLDVRGERGLLSLLRPEGEAGTLDMDGCGFELLPPEVCNLTGRGASLAALVLTNNRLVDLPKELASLVMLTRLVLDSNRLQQLPPPVLVLPRLAVLMVSQNTLTTIPEGISSLRSTLRILTVHSNSLSLLPDTMSCLTRLRVLGASGNRLWCLPTGLCSGCCALRILDCSHNVLDGLPQGMQQLSRLRSLKVNHNRLGWLPTDELAGLPRLAELDVTGNAVAAEVGVDTHAHSSEAVACLLRAVAAAPQEGSSNPQHQPSGQRSTSQPSHNMGVAGALLLTSGISGASPNSDMLPPPLPPLPPAIKHGRPLQQQHAQASRACTASSSSNQRRSVNWTVPEEDGGGCESTDHVQETRGDVGCSNSDSGDNGDGNNTHNLHVDTMTALPSVACSLHDTAEIISPVQPAATKHSASTGKAAGLCVALEMPCVVLALLRAPPPPQSADAAVPARPQTRARLHRVLEQTARALELLEGSGGPKQGHSEHLTGPSTTT